MERIADESHQALLDQLALEQDFQFGEPGLRIFKKGIYIGNSGIETIDYRSGICPGGNCPDI